MQDFKTMRDMCAEQEEKFQFERFSRRDALNIGLSSAVCAISDIVTVAPIRTSFSVKVISRSSAASLKQMSTSGSS